MIGRDSPPANTTWRRFRKLIGRDLTYQILEGQIRPGFDLPNVGRSNHPQVSASEGYWARLSSSRISHRYAITLVVGD